MKYLKHQLWNCRLCKSKRNKVHVVVVVVISHIQRIGCQPEKTTLHRGQSRSWSAEQGKKEKEKVWQAGVKYLKHQLWKCRLCKSKRNKVHVCSNKSKMVVISKEVYRS